MTRLKLSKKRIANDAARRAKLRKQGKNLIRDLSEFSALCRVPACLVVYGEGDARPVVWPSVYDATQLLQEVIDMPESYEGNSMLDETAVLQQDIAKLEEKLSDRMEENRDLEIRIIINDIDAGRRHGLDDLPHDMVGLIQWVVRTRLEASRDRLKMLREGEEVQPESAAPVVVPQEDMGMVDEVDHRDAEFLQLCDMLGSSSLTA